MSREIKFRVWLKGQMVYITPDDDYFIDGDGKLVKVEQIENGCNYQGFEDYECNLMQYTGLKDKHGTEIFEGDILKCKCWDKRKSSIDGFDPLGETPYFYRNSVIEWWRSHCNLGYRLRDGKGKTLMIKPSSLNAMEVEVIGNIYEHKHLLEETA